MALRLNSLNALTASSEVIIKPASYAMRDVRQDFGTAFYTDTKLAFEALSDSEAMINWNADLVTQEPAFTGRIFGLSPLALSSCCSDSETLFKAARPPAVPKKALLGWRFETDEMNDNDNDDGWMIMMMMMDG